MDVPPNSNPVRRRIIPTVVKLTLTCIGLGGVPPGPVSCCPMLSRYFWGVRL
jgi:hypothetical protein